MVGSERVVLPLIAQSDFGLASRAGNFSFIVSFGLVKAGANLFAGRLGDRVGRKKVLIAGWLFDVSVPFATLLRAIMGVDRRREHAFGRKPGLAWSTTVIMKIDLVGPKRRGLAMGLNEAAGYGPFGGRAARRLSRGGLWSSISALYWSADSPPHRAAAVRRLRPRIKSHAQVEARGRTPSDRPFREIFWLTSWKDRTLFSVCQAGMVNNLNDGMAWGIFPLFRRWRFGASRSQHSWRALPCCMERGPTCDRSAE